MIARVNRDSLVNLAGCADRAAEIATKLQKLEGEQRTCDNCGGQPRGEGGAVCDVCEGHGWKSPDWDEEIQPVYDELTAPTEDLELWLPIVAVWMRENRYPDAAGEIEGQIETIGMLLEGVFPDANAAVQDYRTIARTLRDVADRAFPVCPTCGAPEPCSAHRS